MRRHHLIVVLGGMAVVSAMPAHADIGLASHRAVYELRLVEARETGGVRGASGRFAMEFQQSACEGARTVYRQVMALDNENGARTVIDFRNTTVERADSFDFTSETLIDGKSTTKLSGKAERTREGLQVLMTEPGELEAGIPGPAVMFPVEHTTALLKAAREGRAVVTTRVYDGSEPGDEAFETFSMVGERKELDGEAASMLRKARLDDGAVWPITVSFFENQPGAVDQAPKFLYTGDMLDNGIVTSVRFDYITFSVQGRLVEIEALAPKPCP